MPAMTTLPGIRSEVRDRATKVFRDTLKRRGLKLIEVRSYAVVRTNDGEDLSIGTMDDIFKWAARKMREGEL
jgi:hypothetical protein